MPNWAIALLVLAGLVLGGLITYVLLMLYFAKSLRK